LNGRLSFVARRSRDQEIKKSRDQEIKKSRNQEIKKSRRIRRSRNQKDQEFHAQSTKTLSYSNHQSRFEDIHQQEYQARIPNKNIKYEYQIFQDSIDNNHGKS
jgi:hypothetical protein